MSTLCEIVNPPLSKGLQFVANYSISHSSSTAVYRNNFLTLKEIYLLFLSVCVIYVGLWMHLVDGL